jgi:caffeoyl-CoA O-methyltransferase
MNYETIHTYIETLYHQNQPSAKQTYINKSEISDFVPVIDDDVARMIALLISIKKPLHVLEIGTSIGYSSVAIAKTLQAYGGHLTTIEYDREVAAQAQALFRKSNVDQVISLSIGGARDILPDLQGPYDLIFQDADKHLYAPLFDECLRLLAPGGLFLAEDTLFPVIDLDKKWHDLIPPIEAFNQKVIQCPYLTSTILPIGDGLMIAQKHV